MSQRPTILATVVLAMAACSHHPPAPPPQQPAPPPQRADGGLSKASAEQLAENQTECEQEARIASAHGGTAQGVLLAAAYDDWRKEHNRWIEFLASTIASQRFVMPRDGQADRAWEVYDKPASAAEAAVSRYSLLRRQVVQDTDDKDFDLIGQAARSYQNVGRQVLSRESRLSAPAARAAADQVVQFRCR